LEAFEQYLASKKIDAGAYRQAEPEQYRSFAGIFTQVSESSFTAQKLFLINKIRRRFPLEDTATKPKN
jgi:hypothetical protein